MIIEIIWGIIGSFVSFPHFKLKLNHHNPSQSLHADFLNTFSAFASRDIWTVLSLLWMIFFSADVSHTCFFLLDPQAVFWWHILIWACLRNMLHLLTDRNRFVRSYLTRGCTATHTTAGCWDTAGIDRTACWAVQFLSHATFSVFHSS